MKFLSIFKIITLVLISTQSFAQATSSVVPVSSSSLVDDIKVISKATSSGTIIIGNKPVVRVRPEITVSLTDVVDVSRIYLEILDKKNETIVYKANYGLGDPTIVQDNIKLFERDNLNFYFSTPSLLDRDNYLYKVFTEDKLGNLSKEFIQQK